jgi:hypothetical protein
MKKTAGKATNKKRKAEKSKGGAVSTPILITLKLVPHINTTSSVSKESRNVIRNA